MRRLRALAAAAVLAFTVAACGAATKNRPRATVASSSSDCDLKGITVAPRREGVCVARGVTITVADRAHWLHGKEYAARIQVVRTARTLHARSGTLRAHGRFVIVRLVIKNTLGVPHEFDRASDLVFLFVDGKYFGESRAAESIPTLRPFKLRSAELQPDEVATGTVVFDVPLQHAKNLSTQGSNLIFVDFSDAAKRFPEGTQPLAALGYIRLWK